MQWTVENKISSGRGLALMIVVVIVSITCRVTTCFIQDTDWVAHSDKVIEALNDLRSTMQDIEFSLSRDDGRSSFYGRDDGVGFDMQYVDRFRTRNPG